MLFTQENARQAVRNQEGRRVFWLSPEDRLTPAARDWLREENIPIVERQRGFEDLLGGYYEKKPEEMTHLSGNVLVPKTHRRIAFRGEIDALQSQILLFGGEIPQLQELLDYLRELLRREVMEEPLEEKPLLGLGQKELRAISHYPQKTLGVGHFQPQFSDGREILILNYLRTQIRKAELSCCRAFSDRDGKITRPDLVQGLNRLSSACYILMLRRKAEKEGIPVERH